jgi:hypothetical protein
MKLSQSYVIVPIRPQRFVFLPLIPTSLECFILYNQIADLDLSLLSLLSCF